MQSGSASHKGKIRTPSDKKCTFAGANTEYGSCVLLLFGFCLQAQTITGWFFLKACAGCCLCCNGSARGDDKHESPK